MKVAVFGGTGFVGTYIIKQLLSQGNRPHLLVRTGSEKKIENKNDCNIVIGDINDNNSINETLKECQAIIYNIGIIREFPNKGITYYNLHYEGAKRCIDAAIKLKIRRFILMSANGVKENGTGYQKTKFLAEQYLKTSNLDYTIFRPSLVFGRPIDPSHPEFCSQLKKDMLDIPFPAPNFFIGINPIQAGDFAMSPIHVKDVANIFVKSINENRTIKKTYCLGGKKIYWENIIKIISDSYGKNKWIIPAPLFVVKAIANVFEGFEWFPITKDQLTMLIEGNICNSLEIKKIFDIGLIPFCSDSLTYLNKTN